MKIEAEMTPRLQICVEQTGRAVLPPRACHVTYQRSDRLSDVAAWALTSHMSTSLMDRFEWNAPLCTSKTRFCLALAVAIGRRPWECPGWKGIVVTQIAFNIKGCRGNGT